MPTSKPRRAYHHGDLRAALLDVAVDVIAEKGLTGLSLRECARRLGVSHAAPYRHFPTREDLLHSLAERGFLQLTEAGRAAMAPLEQPRARLDAYGVAYVQFAVENPELHRVMFTAQLTGVPPGPEAAADGAFALLRECAVAAAPDADPELAAFAYWSLVHGIAMLVLDGRVPQERLEGDGAIEALTRSVMARWRAGGPPRGGG